MNIFIKNIKIQSISNIGSLNIGKTILAQNRATETSISPAKEHTLEKEIDLLSPTTTPQPTPAPALTPALSREEELENDNV